LKRSANKPHALNSLPPESAHPTIQSEADVEPAIRQGRENEVREYLAENFSEDIATIARKDGKRDSEIGPIVSDVLHRVLRALVNRNDPENQKAKTNKVKPIHKFKPYIAMHARYELKDRGKRVKRRRDKESIAAKEQKARRKLEEVRGIWIPEKRRDKLKDMTKWLKGLSKLDRTIVKMRAVDNLSPKIIGALLEMPKSTVENHYKEAKKHIRLAHPERVASDTPPEGVTEQ